MRTVTKTIIATVTAVVTLAVIAAVVFISSTSASGYKASRHRDAKDIMACIDANVHSASPTTRDCTQ
jgi:hypothetical protein